MYTLDRRHYQLLLALSQHGGISAAAEGLGITQSAASQRLREAERRLGLKLVERVGKSIRLLPAGRHLAAAASTSERILGHAETEAAWLARAGGKSVKLILSSYDDSRWIVALSRHLSSLGEDIRLEIVRSRPGDELRMILEKRADLALLPNQVNAPGLRINPVFADKLVGCLPSDDPLVKTDSVAPDDIVDRPYITYSSVPEAGFEFEGFLRPQNRFPHHVVRVESTSAIIEMVAAGLGVSILSNWVLSDAAARKAVVVRDLRPRPEDIRWSIVTRSEHSNVWLERCLGKVAAWAKDTLPGPSG